MVISILAMWIVNQTVGLDLLVDTELILRIFPTGSIMPVINHGYGLNGKGRL
jgi:hypothetical protein